eukprot:TRINITY_DN105544_c0_g1_i1.p1 TRINITY_DN105544_c0_g1~~TRINITY_DN105544_c0_g1_i1.p1  ORF type:complete len:817 (+),score=151.13 TRINITY_DN105544_c0_g1_i1:243-2693(+)
MKRKLRERPARTARSVREVTVDDEDTASSSETAEMENDDTDWEERRGAGTIRAAYKHAEEMLVKLKESAQAAIIEALAGPGDASMGSLRSRSASFEADMKRGCLKLHEDFWSESSDLAARSASFGLLKEHQRVGVRWLLALHSCAPGMILADEMGLGKTLQSLCFLELLSSKEPSLIVAPASLLDTWEAEAARWTPSLRVLKYHAESVDDRKAHREEFFRGDYKLVLVTYQALGSKIDQAKFFNLIQFNYLICDEAHCLRTEETLQFRNLAKVRCNRRLLLTGTPVQNSLQELATLLAFALSCNGSPELSQYLQAVSMKSHRQAVRKLHEVAGPFVLRRLKSDVLKDLREKHCVVIYCDLKGLQLQQYEEEMLHARSGREELGAIKLAFMKLRQVCLHPLLGRRRFNHAQLSDLVDRLVELRKDFQAAPRAVVEGEVHDWSDFEIHQAAKSLGLHSEFQVSEEDLKSSVKMTELLRILQERACAGEKTLVFSQFVRLLDIAEETLRIAGIGCIRRLDGETPIRERHAIASAFQNDPGSSVFLMTTKTGGVGLNLTAANAVVMLDLDFNPQNMRQAEDRAHRIGQLRKVTVYYLVCRGTVEEMVLRRNLRKMQLDAEFGGRNVVLQAAGTDGAECEKHVLVELQQLLCQSARPRTGLLPSGEPRDEEDDNLATLMDVSQFLPPDAPPGHIAHSKIKYIHRKTVIAFQFGPSKIALQVTLRQAGSRHAAEVIARACWLKFELGWSKDEVTKFKLECIERVSTATMTIGRMALSSQPMPARCPQSLQCPAELVGSRVGGETIDPVSDSDTSTECVLLSN